jgi:predicted transposase/invertase (TIGR01784 family)
MSQFNDITQHGVPVRADPTRKLPPVNDWHELSGKINYSLCNDYLFRALLQTDPDALNYLISCLLELPLDTLNVVIQNPIELGDEISDKDYVLDLKVLVNNEILCNVEMQVWNQSYWAPRSLAYLCKTFADQFSYGGKFVHPMPAIHVGILSFSFPNVDKFYSHFFMMEKDSHAVYSSLLQINVLSLLHLDKATTADRSSGLFTWARFFRAGTWEELKMLEKEDARIGTAANTVFRLMCDDKVRMQMEAREDFYRIMDSYKEELEEQRAKIEEQSKELAAANDQLKEKNDQLKEKDRLIAELQAALSKK